MIVPSLQSGARVLVATRPIDFRAGINRLVALTSQVLAADPYGGDIFIYRSKRADRLKALHWDGSGMIVAVMQKGGVKELPYVDGLLDPFMSVV